MDNISGIERDEEVAGRRRSANACRQIGGETAKNTIWLAFLTNGSTFTFFYGLARPKVSKNTSNKAGTSSGMTHLASVASAKESKMLRTTKIVAIVTAALIGAPTVASAQMSNDSSMQSGMQSGGSMGMSKGKSSMKKRKKMMGKKSGMMKSGGSMGSGGGM